MGQKTLAPGGEVHHTGINKNNDDDDDDDDDDDVDVDDDGVVVDMIVRCCP